ncbi:MAG: monothiol bacilliredoxin BrxC family protein [Trueperaceae bacterium]
MFKDRVINLTTPDEVSEFLAAHPTSVVFKAGTCHKTMQGFGFLQERLEPREDLYVGLIRVVEARSASNLVAEQTGIRHESPQVILFRDGKPVFDADNWSITPEALSDGFQHLPSVEGAGNGSPRAASDLAPYVQLLERYLAGAIDERQFEQAYTTAFRDDASLRSRQEVEVLNSIFGDVDQHMNMHLMMAGRSDTSQVRERAEQAYQQLLSLA